MRRAELVALLAIVAAALAVVAGGAAARERPAKIERLALADGALALSNSHADQAIVSARGMMPGDSVSGTLTLGNTGEQPGALMLSRAAMVEAPGLGGGRLSDVLTLTIEDVAGGEMVAGELGGLERIRLQDLAAGERRTYRFTVSWPAAGPRGADNAYMAGSLQVDYAWLTEPRPAAPVTAPGAVPPPPSGTEGGPPVAPSAPDLAPRLRLWVPRQRIIHTAYIRIHARCSERCAVRFTGRAATAPRGRGLRPLTLKRRGVFRREGRERRIRVGARQTVRLRLSRAGFRVLRRALDTKGRVAVVIRARVRGARGQRVVKRRIVLRTTLIRDGRRIR